MFTVSARDFASSWHAAGGQGRKWEPSMRILPVVVIFGMTACDSDGSTGLDSGLTDSDADTDADTDSDSDGDADSDADSDADADADSDADADADSDADSDADTDSDTDTDGCTSAFTFTMGNGDSVTLDGCTAFTIDGTHTWDDSAPPEVATYEVTWSTGEAECAIHWSQLGLCGTGYYVVEDPISNLTADLTGCADVPADARASYETNDAWFEITALSAGSDSGDQDGLALDSRLDGTVTARVGSGFGSMALSGEFSFSGDVTGQTDGGPDHCTVTDGDEDNDGHVDEYFGGDDCDDSDAETYPGAEETADDGIDQDCDGADLEGEYFDDYAIGFTYYFGYYGSDPESVFISGAEQVPIMLITLYEEEYFATGDDIYTCLWYGEMSGFADHDLNYSDTTLWEGWEFSVAEIYNDCDSLNPTNWGDTTPSYLLESQMWAMGMAELSTSFAGDLETAVGGSSTWTSDYEPYMYAGIVGFNDTSIGDFVGYETNYGLTYETDESNELVTDSSGYASSVELDGSGAPHGYVIHGAYWLYYVEGLMY
jgi:hypothetical protein